MQATETTVLAIYIHMHFISRNINATSYKIKNINPSKQATETFVLLLMRVFSFIAAHIPVFPSVDIMKLGAGRISHNAVIRLLNI